MIALIQRVAHARVEVGPRCTGAIDAGLLALIGIQPGDDAPQRNRMLALLLGYRIFEDDCGRMNRSLQDVQGGLLLVPQFTLAADTRSGLRPSFSSAASPELGRAQFELLLTEARAGYPIVASGEFGAHMRVSLLNDGPVTFWLQS